MVEELGGPDFCRAPGPLGFLPGQPVPSEILVQGSGVAVMVLQHSAERVPVRDSPAIREHDHVPPGEHELRVGQTEELVVEGTLGRPDLTGLAGRFEEHLWRSGSKCAGTLSPTSSQNGTTPASDCW